MFTPCLKVYKELYHLLYSLDLTKDHKKKKLLSKLCKIHAMEYFVAL